MNKIIINNPVVKDRTISYEYRVSGEWKKCFIEAEKAFVEYSISVDSVPKSVAIVPFLCNILPMAWVYNAEIEIEECDEDFYNSIEDIKNGYSNMYPMLDFSADIKVKKFVKNIPAKTGKAAVFFSGGADAFNTLVMHAEEKPTLLTVWGADVTFEDEKGWNLVVDHLKDTANRFGVDYITIKSSFRRFINAWELTQHVKKTKDNWWHGFQHGIGIIGHCAPISYITGTTCVYFASSFTIKERGLVTCASDPTIDNMLHFCQTNIYHDGYEFNRQAKLHNITSYAKKNDKKISLRVCWLSDGGSNCCHCEKCIRTIMGVYAEGFEPREFGFNFKDSEIKKISRFLKYDDSKQIGKLRYEPIQKAMRNNCKIDDLPKELKWFYKTDIGKLGVHPVVSFFVKYKKKVVKKIGRLINGFK